MVVLVVAGAMGLPWVLLIASVVAAEKILPRILEDRDPIPSGAHARHVVEIIEKAYRSAREGQTLELVTTL